MNVFKSDVVVAFLCIVGIVMPYPFIFDLCGKSYMIVGLAIMSMLFFALWMLFLHKTDNLKRESE